MNIQRVADVYISGVHTPDHPSYVAFVKDTLAQWDKLQAEGFKFTLVGPDSIAYQTSEAMLSDISSGRLRVDTAGQNFAPRHPLAEVDIASGWKLNEIFRAVHDVNGHGATQCPFETFNGEVEAYENHRNLYSPESVPALYSETIGQLCYYYVMNQFVPVQRAVIINP